MDNRKAFTLVELLTVLVIIALVVGILLPSIATVRRIARQTAQKAQFTSIDVALEAFKQDYGDYPDSCEVDVAGLPYCGAMKLAEAMVGQDLKGFNLESIFRRDGTLDGTPATERYPSNPGPAAATYPDYVNNIRARRMYLQLETASPHRLNDIYTSAHLSGTNYSGLGANDANMVLCDVYKRTMSTGKKVGMPILYYRADTSKVEHGWPERASSTYYYRDNQDLVDIPIPWDSSANPVHPMASGGLTLLGIQTGILGNPLGPWLFYDETRDERIPAVSGKRPYNASTYILMSAGADNEYGTSDDIFNF